MAPTLIGAIATVRPYDGQHTRGEAVSDHGRVRANGAIDPSGGMQGSGLACAEAERAAQSARFTGV